jgi:hypothetical protein
MSQNINLEKDKIVSEDNEIDLDRDFVIDNSLKNNSNDSDISKKKQNSNSKNKAVDMMIEQFSNIETYKNPEN